MPLVFVKERHPSHLVYQGRKIPVYKSKGMDDNGKTVFGGVMNVPFEIHQFLVGHPHWENYEGQVELPAELQDYAEGKVGDPILEDFPLVEEAEKADTKKPAKK